MSPDSSAVHLRPLLFPILVCRGTHESTNAVVDGLFDPASPDLYYALGIGGDQLRIYTLNSEVTEAGTQGAWLENDLLANAAAQFKVAQYHKPFRPHNLAKSEGNAEYTAWAQTFFDHGLDLAIESDSHCAKITWPLRPDSGPGSDEGFIRDDLNGTVFAGEGGWGAPLRSAGDSKEWTLDSGSFNHFTWVHVLSDHMEIRTVLTEEEPGVSPVTEGDPLTPPAGLKLWQHVGGPVVRIPRLTSAASDEILLPAHAAWKFHDAPDPPPAGWADAAFDDSTWLSGAARLGYGGDGETTSWPLNSIRQTRRVPTSAWTRSCSQTARPGSPPGHNTTSAPPRPTRRSPTPDKTRTRTRCRTRSSLPRRSTR